MLTLRHLAISAATVLGISLSLPAQCYEPATGASIGTGDDVVLGMQALGFAFPFGGATYTHVHPVTNGFLYLSNAGVPAPTQGALCCAGSTASLVAGTPKVCPYWSDLNVIAPGSVKFNAMPGKAVITWENVVEYGTTSPTFSFQVQLLASGDILFAYDSRCVIGTHTFLTGMSEGGAVPVPATSNYSTPNVTVTTTSYEMFVNPGSPFDLTGKTLQFFPAGVGYAWVASNCASAHTTYGSGCYTTSNSFYQLTTPPAVSAATLNGTAITLFPTPTGYVVVNTGTYLPPTGAATAIVLTDDSEAATPALTTPFPYPGGTAATLMVCSNGYVSVATGNGVGYVPTVSTMLANPQTGWYAWHDYNPAAAGSGQVKFEQVSPTLVTITWDGVYNFSGTTVADANTMQFQFDSTTASITIAHVSVSTNGHTLPAGEPHLVGYSPAGASNDPGNMTFATGLPLTVGTVQMLALALSASPNPTPGSTTTYTTSNIPEFAPSSGVYVGLNILSVGQIPPPGLDLGFLGAPGCPLNVASLDLVQSMVGFSATQTVTFSWPLLLPVGTTIYSQSASLFTPNSLPNGQNAFGATTSNGITSFVGVW